MPVAAVNSIAVASVAAIDGVSGLGFVNGIEWPAGGGSDPNFADVELLLHMNGTDASTSFVDSSSNSHTVSAQGNAQIDTAQSMFGGASGLFDGSGDYLTATLASTDYGSVAHCIEAWIRAPSAVSVLPLFGFGAGGNAYQLNFFSGTWFVGNGSINPIAATISPTIDVWHHIAVTFDGTTRRFFFDGNIPSGGSTTTALPTGSQTDLMVGARTGQSWYVDGWIDDFRITIGHARYTSAFTPPAAQFPDS